MKILKFLGIQSTYGPFQPPGLLGQTRSLRRTTIIKESVPLLTGFVGLRSICQVEQNRSNFDLSNDLVVMSNSLKSDLVLYSRMMFYPLMKLVMLLFLAHKLRK